MPALRTGRRGLTGALALLEAIEFDRLAARGPGRVNLQRLGTKSAAGSVTSGQNGASPHAGLEKFSLN